MKTAKRLFVSLGMTLLGFIAIILAIVFIVAVIMWLVSFLPKDLDENIVGYTSAALFFGGLFIMAWKHAYDNYKL